MRTVLTWVAVPLLAIALVPFLADWHAPFAPLGPGIAYAKGGGGGGGNDGGGEGGNGNGGRGGGQGAGGTDGGGHGADQDGGRGGGGLSGDADSGSRMGHGHEGRGVGNAVSEAATSTAHAGKGAAREAEFTNLGQAVSTAVHDAQRDRDRDRDLDHARLQDQDRDRHQGRLRDRDRDRDEVRLRDHDRDWDRARLRDRDRDRDRVASRHHRHRHRASGISQPLAFMERWFHTWRSGHRREAPAQEARVTKATHRSTRDRTQTGSGLRADRPLATGTSPTLPAQSGAPGVGTIGFASGD